MLDVLGLIGRNSPLFVSDINNNKEHLCRAVSKGSFLVLGGCLVNLSISPIEI